MSTKSQEITFSFIEEFITEHGYSPSISEIMQGTDRRSRSLVQSHLRALAEAGRIKKGENRQRDITLCNPTSQANWSLPLVGNEANLSLPLVGSIAAGQPTEAIAEPEMVDLSTILLGPNRYLVRIIGDSMAGDYICDGDYAVCEQATKINEGKIAAVLIDNSEVSLKRVCYNRDNSVTLLPSNPAYSPMNYDAERVQIQGELVHLLRLMGTNL